VKIPLSKAEAVDMHAENEEDGGDDEQKADDPNEIERELRESIKSVLLPSNPNRCRKGEERLIVDGLSHTCKHR